MQFVRKSLIILITPLLTLFLLATALDFSLVKTFGNPEPIKHVLKDSGIYSSVVNSSLDQAGQINGPSGPVPLGEQVVRTAASQTFTPQFIQQNTETVINSIYRWLDGKTPLPDFYVDLSSLRTSFASNVATALTQQLSALPVCTSANTPTNFDAFNATCLPRGVTPSSAAATVQSDILSGQGFIDNPVITADSVKASGSNQSIFADQLKKAPAWYRDAKALPLILALAAVITGAIIVFLSSTRRKGIRRVAVTTLSVGVLLLVFAWLSNHLVSTINSSLNLNNPVLEKSMRTIITDISKDLHKTYWVFGGGYAAAGILAIAGTILIKPPKAQTAPEKTGQDTPEPEEPVKEEPKEEPKEEKPVVKKEPEPAAKSTKKKIVVQ